MKAKTVLPAVAMTAVSMVLTLAVVVMWLGMAVPWLVALVVGLGIDGGWLATLAYERRLAAQGDHSRVVTGVGWFFGLIAAGVLVAHALTADGSAAWLAVAWLPIAAKALWLVHGLWERTALTPAALASIRGIQQEARDRAAVDRARLRAEAVTEETRLTAVTGAGARVARVQAKTAKTLSGAWSELERARAGEDTGRALASVASRPAPGGAPCWELPVWGPIEPVPAPLVASIDPADDDSANAEESTRTERFRSTADLPESTPVMVTLTRLPVPDPVPADAGKSSLPFKPIPALTTPTGSTRSGSTRSGSTRSGRPVAAESTRPAVRATFRVPESAKSPRVKRTPEQLLEEARTLTADWPQIHLTGERIRRELHVSPARARTLRDALIAERAT
ncbi:hypothetical protein ACFV2N_14795 [Streptomyces sp. NPDC059680]|uniref:hypothetical protein n=1 Tax=Streptomyces sp. NPDC059680 TaxID=3346904 RepID=UPI00368D4CBC